MSGIIARLKDLCRIPSQQDTLAQQLTAVSGLPVLDEQEFDDDYIALMAQLDPLSKARDFPALAVLCQQSFAKRERLVTGRAVYEFILDAMMAAVAQSDQDPAQCEDELVAYRTWWDLDRTDPAAAGAYGLALAYTGYTYRGQGLARSVSESQWAMLLDFANRSMDVLEAAGPGREASWIWHRCRYTATFIAYGIGQASADNVSRAFEEVQALDPFEAGIYEERVNQLLPRWGGSFQEIETFARQSYALTKSKAGAEFYARVYNSLFEYEEPRDTLVDYHLLREGLETMYARAPSQRLANRFAAHAHAAGDIETTAWLFQRELRVIYPNVWFGPRQPLLAWQAVRKARSPG